MRLMVQPTEQIFRKALKSEARYEFFVEDFKEILEVNGSVTQTPVLYDKYAFIYFYF